MNLTSHDVPLYPLGHLHSSIPRTVGLVVSLPLGAPTSMYTLDILHGYQQAKQN